jgi:hypothetical protein
MTTDRKNIFRGHAIEISEELRKSTMGTHALLLYPDLLTLRELYSFYTRSALSDNEIVLILPFLETTGTVRRMLSGDSANIDVRKYEKEQSLLIIDSLKGYFSIQEGLMPFVRRTVKFAKTSGHADGVSALGDVASFFHLQKKDDLLYYEMTLPTKFEGINLKWFCLYHKQDFDKVLSEKERQMLLKHHGKTLYLLPSPVVS